MKKLHNTNQKSKKKSVKADVGFGVTCGLRLATSDSRYARGFTILETIVAVLILSISITAIVVVAGGGAQKTIHTKDRLIAAYLAQEGVELVRNVRDSAFLSFEDDLSVTARWNAFGELMEPCFSEGCAVSFDNEAAFDVSIPVLITPDVNEHLSFDEVSGRYEYGGDNETMFVRKVRLFETGGDGSSVRVEVSVDYREGTETRTYTTSEVLFNWF